MNLKKSKPLTRIAALSLAATLLSIPATAKDGIYVGGMSKCLTDDHRMLTCGEEAVCNVALKTCSYGGVAGKFVPGKTSGKELAIKKAPVNK